jgi:hypothetical protein
MSHSPEQPEDARETVVEGLKRTKQILGPIFPAIVEKGTMNILDGNTRKRADPSWPEREIEITDPKQRILIPVFANYRRRVPKEETQGQILHLIELLNREGVPDDQMAEKVCSMLPYTPRYIRSLLPSKFKKIENAHKPQKPKTPFLTPEEASVTAKVPLPDGSTLEMPLKFATSGSSDFVCPTCRTVIEKVTCTRCMADITVRNIKGDKS